MHTVHGRASLAVLNNVYVKRPPSIAIYIQVDILKDTEVLPALGLIDHRFYPRLDTGTTSAPIVIAANEARVLAFR